MEILLITIIVLAIILMIILFIYWRFQSIFSTPSTGKISDGIIAITNSFVSSFIYTKESDIIMIDTGFSKKGMKSALNELNISPNEISNVFLTHSDGDHTGGISLFNSANIYFGKDTKIKNSENFMFLDDSEVVKVGNIKIQSIATPGHRAGHTSYLIDDKYLFTGDLIRLKDNEAKPFIKIISSDSKKMEESIEKLARIKGIKMLFTAHTGYTGEFSDAMEKWNN
ncbi:MAG: MBL fold metallo-hydrolase [Candidatus Lokiarchaeota archaeon]|nr:MBL fold metallo-hydrolase [Candidatus Lokiarchaeota archaeon]MBD3198675.1 MBL fold metallo-hydrolase [Candidatus Lokiarchaeota archaeon]